LIVADQPAAAAAHRAATAPDPGRAPPLRAAAAPDAGPGRAPPQDRCRAPPPLLAARRRRTRCCDRAGADSGRAPPRSPSPPHAAAARCPIGLARPSSSMSLGDVASIVSRM